MESLREKLLHECGAGISPFSVEWPGNLLSFFKEIPMIVDIGTFYTWLFLGNTYDRRLEGWNIYRTQ
jgi:hypothetical protein